MTESSPPDQSDAYHSITSTSDILGRAPIKRARPQLSCTPCRQGKLKCNREHPICDQCAKRSRHEACQYLPPPPRNKQAQNMRGRIRNLESLVVNLINQKAEEQGVQPQEVAKVVSSDQDRVPKVDNEPEAEPNVESFGQLRISHAGQETSYVGAGHWSSLLKEIEDVKDSLDEDNEPDEGHGEEGCDYRNLHSNITFGLPRPMTKVQLIEEMPPKNEVDRLLPLWFNSADPLLYLIHAPTFQEEYKQFWKDPSSTSVMWISMLYSALALGIILGPRNPGMIPYDDQNARSNSDTLFDKTDKLAAAVNKFQQLASSAILVADIAKLQPYTLEALMVYGECEFLRRDDRHTKIWLMHGVTLRVAMRMGYHRDPVSFPGITPFQGEMRRRIWHVLNMMDTLVSFTVGLPTSLRSVECDVRAPHNLYDHDISPDMPRLPKERPITEITPASYVIAKSRVCSVFAEAAELSHKILPPRHATIMDVDKRLEEAHDLIPEGMRMKPMEDCITDPPVLIMSRFNIELMYQKTRIVLHRNYLTAGQTDSRFLTSRTICVDAAVNILNYQKTIVHACSPGGQLNKVWWYMSSLTTYDFLLAAMVLCLELNHCKTGASSSAKRQELLDILWNTHDIWKNYPVRFRESARGIAMLEAMLKKSSEDVFSQTDLKRSGTEVPDGFDKTMTPPSELTPETLPEERPPQIWGAPWRQTDVSSVDMPDIPSEIDWNLWDSTMHGQSTTDILLQQGAANSGAMDSWMGMAANVDSTLDGMYDFSDPLNLYNPSGSIPPQDGAINVWPPL